MPRRPDAEMAPLRTAVIGWSALTSEEQAALRLPTTKTGIAEYLGLSSKSVHRYLA